MRDITDNELIKRALEGDQTAFKILYMRYLPKVHSFAYRSVGSREDAENVTAEAFLNAFSKINQFKGEKFGTWLFAIARNEIARYWRERYRTKSIIEAIAADDSPADDAFEAGERKISDTIARIMTALPETFRRVLELRFLKGMSLAETAEELGMTVGNVKVTQYRALKKAAEMGWNE